jgi:bacterioferritin
MATARSGWLATPRRRSARGAPSCEVFALAFACLKSAWQCTNMRAQEQERARNAMTDSDLDADLTTKLIASLNRILELELAGVVRYMHYSFMIFGHNRIPIVAWLRDQANESNAHAVLAGEHITAFGGHPSLKIGALLETHQHDINEILKEAYEHEKEGLDAYYDLLKLAEGKSILLEEYARDQIAAEEMHLADIRKMMRKPGSIR